MSKWKQGVRTLVACSVVAFVILILAINSEVSANAAPNLANATDIQILGDEMIWQEFQSAGHKKLVYFNVATGEQRDITTGSSAVDAPYIDGDYIVWADKGEEPDSTMYWDIMRYQISTGVKTKLTTKAGLYSNPTVDANGALWYDHTHSGYMIYYDFSTGRQSNIGEGRFPVLVDGVVVYKNARDGGLSLLMIKTGVKRSLIMLGAPNNIDSFVFNGKYILALQYNVPRESKYVTMDVLNIASTAIDITEFSSKKLVYAFMSVSDKYAAFIEQTSDTPELKVYNRNNDTVSIISTYDSMGKLIGISGTKLFYVGLDGVLDYIELDEETDDGTDTPEGPGAGEGTDTPEGPGAGEGTDTPEGPGAGEGTDTPEGPGAGEGTDTPEGPGTGNGTDTPEGPGTGNGTDTPEGPGTGNGTGTPEGPGTGNGSGTSEEPGTDNGTDTSAQAQEQYSKIMNQDGGELATDDRRVIINFVKDSLLTGTKVSITRKPSNEYLLVDKNGHQLKPASDIWLLETEHSFAQASLLRLSNALNDFTNADYDKLGVYRWNDSLDYWEYIGGANQVMAGVTQTYITEAGTYAVMLRNISFNDIQKHWGQHAIEALASREIIDGISESRFIPDQSITRAEFIKLLVGAMGLEIKESDSPTFGDVASNAWYYSWVETAAKAGIVLGSGDKFKPDEAITREQMVVMLIRAVGIQLGEQEDTDNLTELVAFKDHDSVSEWAKSSVNTAIHMNLIQGNDSALQPLQKTSRAESATVIYRLLLALDNL